MDKLPKKQQNLILELLSGKSIREASEVAGVSYDWAKQLHCNRDPKRTQAFYDVLQEERRKQNERISQGIVDKAVARVSEVDRSKEALLAELEEIADYCKIEIPIVSKKSGEVVGYERDISNWIKTVIERGKLLGYYVDKKEHSGKFTVADIIGSIDVDDEDEDE